ncbi:hypothetical protein D3C77_252980 [compost metagenome]
MMFERLLFLFQYAIQITQAFRLFLEQRLDAVDGLQVFLHLYGFVRERRFDDADLGRILLDHDGLEVKALAQLQKVLLVDLDLVLGRFGTIENLYEDVVGAVSKLASGLGQLLNVPFIVSPALTTPLFDFTDHCGEEGVAHRVEGDDLLYQPKHHFVDFVL